MDGLGKGKFPVREDDHLVAEIGANEAVDLLPRIRAVEEDFYRSDAHLTAPTTELMGQLAARRFREIHPEISEDAVSALAWCYTFDFK